MKIICRKCGKPFDPATEMAYCAPYYGHAPAAEAAQNLTPALQEKIEKKPKREGFQSDFKLIWNE